MIVDAQTGLSWWILLHSHRSGMKLLTIFAELIIQHQRENGSKIRQSLTRH
jgi:hypothetical protein